MHATSTLNAPLSSQELLSEAVSPLVQRIGLMLMAAVVMVNDSNFTPNVDGAGWELMLKLGICGGCGLYGLLYFLHIRPILFRQGMVWVTLFATWSLLCAPFAVNQTYSIVGVGLLLSMMLFAPALLLSVGLKRILITGVIVLEFYLLACWAMHAVNPELNGFDPDKAHAADAARLGGLSHPNSTANKAVLSIALMVSLLSYRWARFKYLLLPLLFSFSTLLLTGSRTWLAVSLAIMGLAVWRELNIKSRALLISGTMTLVGLVGLILINELDGNFIDSALSGISRSGKSEEIYSMTGRAELWEVVREKIADSPLFGVGYGCQRYAIEDHYWVTRHAHNLILNTALGSGVIGAAFLIFLLLSQIGRALFRDEMFPAAILLMVLIGGIAENPIFNPMPGAIMLFLLITLSGSFEKEQMMAESAPPAAYQSA